MSTIPRTILRSPWTAAEASRLAQGVYRINNPLAPQHPASLPACFPLARNHAATNRIKEPRAPMRRQPVGLLSKGIVAEPDRRLSS